jgi:hypothetical protein
MSGQTDFELGYKAGKSYSNVVRLELQTRIDELEAVVEQLIEVGGWAITGMTIATSYSSSKMNDLAEKHRDEWCALIKKWKESEE